MRLTVQFAFALAAVGLAFWIGTGVMKGEQPTECPSLNDIDSTVIRCASGNPSACDEFASMTDQCVIQWFDSRLMIEPVSAEGEDITV